MKSKRRNKNRGAERLLQSTSDHRTLEATYIAHCIPCLANADEIGVSGSNAKYGTRPTITTETIIYNEQHIDSAVPMPHGKSR